MGGIDDFQNVISGEKHMIDRYSNNSPDVPHIDAEPQLDESEKQDQVSHETKDRYSDHKHQDFEQETTTTFIPLADSLKKTYALPESNLGLVLAVTKKLIRLIKNPTLMLIVSILCLLICIYLYFQVVGFINMIAAYPPWAMWPLLGVLLVLLAITFFAIAKLYLRMRRLRVVKQVRTGDVEVLLKHKTLVETGAAYRLALDKENELYDMLLEYVRAFPSYKSRSQNQNTSVTAQVPDWLDASRKNWGDIETLRRNLAQGAGAAKTYVNRKLWMEGYQRFQKELDQLAENRLGVCARWVGYKTAISPYGVMDMLITAYWSFTLVENLCTIYNVRLGRIGLFVLFCQVVDAIFLVGKIDNAEEYSTEAFEQLIGQMADNSTIKWVVGNAAAKTASGLVNYYIIKRIGKYAMSELQPLRVKS